MAPVGFAAHNSLHGPGPSPVGLSSVQGTAESEPARFTTLRTGPEVGLADLILFNRQHRVERAKRHRYCHVQLDRIARVERDEDGQLL